MDSITLAEGIRIFVDKQYIHQLGDEFIKWLSKEPSSSGGKITDEFEQVFQRFLKDSDFEKFGGYHEGLANRYFESRTKRSSVSPTQQISSADASGTTLVRLVCQTISPGLNTPKTLTLVIDFDKRTVNGYDATFSEGYIKYIYISKDQTRYDYVLDRTASTVNIATANFPNLRSGPCSKAEMRAF
jgi:hypothetical protein